jgi:hypothetical protein
MKELNQLEKQLEDRSTKELEEIIDAFLDNVQKINEKYGGSLYYNYVDGKHSKGTSCIQVYSIRHHLLYMLKDNHLNNMIKYKSKELLHKLDLLS